MSTPERFSKTLFGGGATSSEGYKVFFNGRFSVKYVCDDLVIVIPAEDLATNMTLTLYAEDMRIGSLNGNLVTDNDIRGCISDRVRRAGAFLGWTLA